MKRNFETKILLAVLLLFLGYNVQAQTDSRGRIASTIIADGLAQLPAKDNATFNQVISEMAATGQKGMEQLVDMLGSSAQGKNVTFEYAIDGIVSYVSEAGREGLRDAVRKGLVTGLAKANDKVNAAFIISELQRIPDKSLVGVLKPYLSDSYLQQPVIDVLVQTPDIDDDVIELMKKEAAPKAALANLAYQRKMPAKLVEPVLLSWIDGADTVTLTAIYNALSVCGAEKGMGALHAAAKSVGFGDDSTGATDAYLRALTARYVGKAHTPNDIKIARKAANELIKSGTEASRITGLNVLQAVSDSKTAASILKKALADNDREYRCQALDNASANITESAPVVEKVYPKLKDDAKVDVVRWLGNHHIKQMLPIAVAAMSSDNGQLSEAAIVAAGKIGGDDAVKALITQLGGSHADAVSKALLSCNGNVGKEAEAALNSTDTAVVKSALALVATRKTNSAFPKVLSLTSSDDAAVSQAAYAALGGVAGSSSFSQLCDLLEKSSDPVVAKLQEAAKSAIQSESPAKQYLLVSARIANTNKPQLYYPLLAQSSTKDALNALVKAYGNSSTKEAAYKSLLAVNNPNAINVLYKIAAADSTKRDEAISRELVLLRTSGWSKVHKFDVISKALALNPGNKVADPLLSEFVQVSKGGGIGIVEPYLDNKALQLRAAYVIKDLVTKNLSLQTVQQKDVLMKARNVLKSYKEEGNADAGYAMDAIDGVLPKLVPEYITSLDPNEKKQGFELLFDGKTLDNWHGNKTNYVVDNGTIYVSAAYGNGGNLYTNKKYSDFVYRFEFSFVVPGVNNGIGIRTRENVDAAYEGMEIQVLDHDDPIYKNLQSYQQHGSVYGIIVPKHVNFGPQGTWNTEEIRAIGDSITVTVNGEVILSGNIRKACQGHNVAPDGSGTNPYTVDHRNHPGLFNKSGNISFCGHGEGVRFRNIRILDLSKNQTKAQAKAKGKRQRK